MGTVAIKWIAGKKFVGIDSTQHSVVISTPDEGIGVKPSELLLLALASCTAVDVIEILQKKRMTLTQFEIDITSEQDADPPWTFRHIHMQFLIAGKDLTEQAVAQAIKLAEEKYCSVAATIRATTKITTDFTIQSQ